jgi:hypothetical protein
MDRKEFYEHIKNDFFIERTANIEAFKIMVTSAAPVFGKLETEIEGKENGGRVIRFIDRDEADIVMAPEGVDTSEVNTDMSTVVMTLHLDEEDTIVVVEHGFKIFTRANKEQVLLYSSLIGKKISFDKE